MAAGPVEQIHAWEQGDGEPTVLCLHETAATSAVWRALADKLGAGARLVAYDRPGWGESPAPETFARTTVGEQAAIAAAVLADREGGPAVLCGAGLGAVAALDLSVRRPELVSGCVLIEPPLLAFVPAATEALATAADLVRDAVANGGRDAALDHYLGGGLGVLSAGAERIPAPARAGGPRAVQALFGELAAVPGWELPLGEFGVAAVPSLVVVGTDTHPLVREASYGLSRALARCELRTTGPGLPHHDQAADLAALVIEVAESA